MTYSRTFAPLSAVALAVVLSACTALPALPSPTPTPVVSPWPTPVASAPLSAVAPVSPVETVYVTTPGETVYIDVPGETVYVDVPGPVQVVTDQAALDAAYASGFATAQDQANLSWQGIEEDAYNRGVERGGAWENQNYTQALNTPCATEDSEGCFWDATVQGNGQGRTFVNVAGIVFYLN